MRCIGKIHGIIWQDRIPNKDVLAKAGMSSLFALLTQGHLHWLGHVRRMKNGRIAKDILYRELATVTKPTTMPIVRFKDVCKRDIKTDSINPANWETQATDRSSWRTAIRTCIHTSERGDGSREGGGRKGNVRSR